LGSIRCHRLERARSTSLGRIWICVRIFWWISVLLSESEDGHKCLDQSNVSRMASSTLLKTTPISLLLGILCHSWSCWF
jgi:hypothetical protein